MDSTSFRIGDKFKLIGYGYSAKEVYTVVEVSDEKIEAWMNPPKWTTTCTFTTNFFNGFVGEIKMLPSEALRRRAIKMADHIIENGVVGSVAMDFSNEQGAAA